MNWYMNLYNKEGYLIRRVKCTSVGQLLNWIAYDEGRPKGLGRFTAWSESDFTATDFDAVVSAEFDQEMIDESIGELEESYGFNNFERPDKDGVP